MHFVDRHRGAQRVDVGRGRGWPRQLGLVEHDGRGARAHFRGEGQRIRLQRQMLALRADDIEFVPVARRGVGNEQLPIALAAYAHRMPPCIPEIEIADDADPLRVGRQHDEGHPLDAIQHQRMRAELVVKPLMGAFAQEIQVEIRQHRRKAVGIVEIDDGLAEAGAQAGTIWSRSEADLRTARHCGCASAPRLRHARRPRRPSRRPAGMRAPRSCRPRYGGRDTERDRNDGLPRSHRPRRKAWS